MVYKNSDQKVAILGYTPREEVLVKKIKDQNPKCEILLFTPSTNIALEARVDRVYRIDFNDLNKTLVTPMRQINPQVAIVGPDTLSEKGLVDVLTRERVPTFGANQEQIKVETDKSYLRKRSEQLHSFFPESLVLENKKPNLIRQFSTRHERFVVKYTGIYSVLGGGVKFSDVHFSSFEDIFEYCADSINQCGSVVLEQFVEGIDFSINAIAGADGSVYFLPENFCYKRRDNSDEGPNTSGTGSVCIGRGLPFLSTEQVEKARTITCQVVNWMNSYFGKPYIGGLNVDFRVGRDRKIYLFEVNCRFAGAGTLSTVLDLGNTNVLELVSRAVSGKPLPRHSSQIADQASIAVFAFPQFWPGGTATDDDINVKIPTAETFDDVNLFTGWVEVLESKPDHRIVSLKDSTTLIYETRDVTVQNAMKRVYQKLQSLPDRLVYRTDIGAKLI